MMATKTSNSCFISRFFEMTYEDTHIFSIATYNSIKKKLDLTTNEPRSDTREVRLKNFFV